MIWSYVKHMTQIGSAKGTYFCTWYFPGIFLWHRIRVKWFVNIGFYQARFQKKFSIFFSPRARLLGRWKENYISGFGVSIGANEWDIDDKGNPSWLFLIFTLTSPRLRSFIKSSLSLWNPKTRWGWKLSFLIYVLKVFGTSLMWMVWRPSYLTPNNESTVISGLRMATSCFF